MANGNNGVVGIASDLIDSVKGNLLGAEGVLSDVNMLGMTRPLATINIASQLKEQGGVLPSLQTGVKKMTAARKGGQTSAPPAKRYRPPASSPPPTQQPFKGSPISQEEEVIFI